MTTIKSIFIGGKYDGQQLEVTVMDDGRPCQRVEYIIKRNDLDAKQRFELGVYKIADRYMGPPVFVFQK